MGIWKINIHNTRYSAECKRAKKKRFPTKLTIAVRPSAIICSSKEEKQVFFNKHIRSYNTKERDSLTITLHLFQCRSYGTGGSRNLLLIEFDF